MSEQNTADNWRLDETGDTLDQWKLQEAEQERVAQWQLQRAQYGDPNWQPVDYERQPARRGSWLLPLLVGLALIAVFAYGVWIGLGTLGITNFASLLPSMNPAATPTTAAAAVAPSTLLTTTVETAPTEAPVATVTTAPTETPAPTATPEPLRVEQQIARVTNQYGVNARPAPNTTGDVIEVLPQGAEYVVVETRDDGWIQIGLPSADLVWVSAEFVELRTEQVLLEVANQRRAALGLPPLEVPGAPAPSDSEDASSSAVPTLPGETITDTLTVTDSTLATGTQSITNTAAVTTGVPPEISAAITGTVIITAGLNARSAPTTTAQAVVLLEGGAVVTVTGRSADNEWLQLRLPDDTAAWVFAEYIQLSDSGASTTPTVTTDPTGGGPSAAVNSLSGANARLEPDRNAEAFDVIPYDVVLTVEGRTANNEWLQVEYQGQLVWVLVSTVSLNTELENLPVVTP
ncbi:MAG: SH3 domain-containing protein [Caldilineaceae bacterium]|nr:SH3 domain-containing protein [Caldilineaceae bacterium]